MRNSLTLLGLLASSCAASCSAAAAAVLQVPKSFNMWSLDALSDSDIINSIISLNMRPT
jgi:hypothetical protein